MQPHLQHQPSEAIFQDQSVEVEKQADLAVAHLEVGPGLGLVERKDVFHGFKFQKDGALNNDVSLEGFSRRWLL